MRSVDLTAGEDHVVRSRSGSKRRRHVEPQQLATFTALLQRDETEDVRFAAEGLRIAD
jgi:hypothetical protein